MDSPADPIKPWFDALEDMGEYIGIRFGQVDESTGEVRWYDVSHSECDGIGGFAKILRELGADVTDLPKMPHPARESWWKFIRNLPAYGSSRNRLKLSMESGQTELEQCAAPKALAWHVFSENETVLLRKAARYYQVSVNSLLLRHLDKSIRKSIEDPSVVVPWMIPVNLRGKVTCEKDTANHSSFITVKLKPSSSSPAVHRQIYQKLSRGEQWANWRAYRLGCGLSIDWKKKLIANDRGGAQWNIGGFSNLGVWDHHKLIEQDKCRGPWLFSPPVLECQRIGAGCVTFQNRLSLMVQAHPLLTTDSSVLRMWMKEWVHLAKIDMAIQEH